MNNLSSLLIILAITLPGFVGHSVIGVTSSSRTTTRSPAKAALAPTQSGVESSVRKISLLANDLVADRNSPRIYASVPSSVQITGNSITPIDTVTAAIGQPVLIGSDPGKMVITDNGQFLYVVLNGAAAVRRFDIATQTAGPQFSMGSDPSNGPFFAFDLSVAPGNPHLYAVHRRGGGFEDNVAVFDDGIMRSSTIRFRERTGVAFGASASRLYGYTALPTPATVSRMTVTPAGVVSDGSSRVPTTITTDTIKFDSGRLYTGTGKVVDPEAGTIIGSFALGVNRPVAFAVDSVVGRAFYVSESTQPSTLTIQAFDVNTFQPVGTLDISGANGPASSLVRWGANGLAVSTSGGEVFLIQTNLVPSSEPVPSPTPTPPSTPTPSPTPTPASFVRQISLKTNDLVYNPTNQTIYTSVPSAVGQGGNSITPINPDAGTVGQPVFIGSEPNRLAVTDDGQHIFVGFGRATAVRRFEVASHTAGPQFNLFNNSGSSLFVTDLDVAPGTTDTLAISTGAGIAIFDGGVRRPQFGPGSLSMVQFGDSAARVYSATSDCCGATLQKLTIGPTGVTEAQSSSNLLRSTLFAYSGGLLYLGTAGSFAQVFEPETGTLIASLRLANTNLPSGERCDLTWVVPDASLNRVFYLCGEINSPDSSVKIKAFDTQTFLSAGEIRVGGVVGNIGRMIRWGTNGLAFRTESGQLFLIQTSLVSSADPIPAPTPTPTPVPPVPTPVPTPGPGELRQIALPTRDLVIDPTTQTIFASVAASAGAAGNSITPIDPVAGTAGTPVFVGNEPRKMAISDNHQFIYVALTGDRAIRRFDVATRTAGLQFGLGSEPLFGALGSEDIAVAPGQPGTIAVARVRVGVTPQHAGVAIFDDGIQRPNTTPPHTGSNAIEFSASPSVLYGFNVEGSDFGFRKMGVASCGVATATVVRPAFFGGDFRVVNGLAYSNPGAVINPEDGSMVGSFNPGDVGVVLPDVGAGRIYFLVRGGSSFMTLRVFDSTTYLLLGELQIQIPGFFNFPTPISIVRWGDHGLAFNTSTTVFLLQNAIIGGSVPPPPPAPLPPTPSYTVTGQIFPFFDAEDVRIDVTGSIASSATLTAANPTFSFGGIPACGGVTVTPSKPNYIFSPQSITFNNPSEIQPAFFTAIPNALILSQSTLFLSETLPATSFTVLRFGDTSQPASIDYETISATASDRSDFTAAVGTITFAPGQTSSTIPLLLSDDTLMEGSETFSVRLRNPVGVMLRTPDVLTITIIDNDLTAPTSNPLDEATFFVRQHYHDFLNREPDTAGLNFWRDQITSCGADAQCIELKRINVSAAFFLSIEFQETGYLVYRMYKSGFGNLSGAPVPVRFNEFLRDTQEIGRGVQVGIGNWQALLEANKQAFALAFVQRPEFLTIYPSTLTALQVVTQMDANAGGVLSQAETDDLVALLGSTPSDATKRALVLRSVAEDADLRREEFNKAFVLMQYFGYLRRNSNDAPDTNFDGYNFWLNKLNTFEGNFVNADMVKAFIVSIEFRHRFGP